MNNNLFIYITDDEESLKIVNNGFAFDQPLNLTDCSFYLLPSKTVRINLENEDFPTAILIQDQISVDDFCREVRKIASKYDKIYIAHHSTGLQPSDMNSCEFTDKLIAISGLHEANDVLYSTAIGFIKEDNEAIQNAMDAFEGNPKLESLIHLYKSINIILLKLDDRTWNEANFIREKDGWSADKKKKIKIVESKLTELLYINENGKEVFSTRSVFLKNVEKIEHEISQLSTS